MRFRTLLTTASALALGVGMMASQAAADSDVLIEQVDNGQNNEANVIINNSVGTGLTNNQGWTNQPTNDLANKSNPRRVRNQATGDLNDNNNAGLTIGTGAISGIDDNPDNQSRIVQEGVGDRAAIETTPSASTTYFDVFQESNGNDAGNSIGGPGDNFLLSGTKTVFIASQNTVGSAGGGNTIQGEQGGKKNLVAVGQNGTNQTLTVDQDGDNNAILGDMRGNMDNITVTQGPRTNGNTARVVTR
jgi:hypothetical protein